MEIQSLLNQTRRYITNANKFIVQVGLRTHPEIFMTSVLDEAQKHLEDAKSFIKGIKLKKLMVLRDVSSELDGLSLIEKPDVEVLDKLLNSDLLEMVDYQGREYENERKHLESYRSLVDSDGHVEVRYNKSRNIRIGRSYCNNSLGAIGLRREIRGSIFNRNYTDIDIVNCHPNIYFQLANIMGLDTPALKKYVEERDATLQSVMTAYDVNRDAAKELFIRLLYCGSFTGWSKDNKITRAPLPIINQFQREMLTIGDQIISNNPKLFARIERFQKEYNKYKNRFKVKVSTISYYVQEIENRILESVYKYCKAKGLINDSCCLCYDGIMIENSLYYTELLQEFHDTIFEKFGLDLKFEQKPMKHYLDVLDQRQVALEAPIQIIPVAIDPDDTKLLEYKLLQIIKPCRYDSVRKLVDLAKIIKSINKFKNPLAVWLEICYRAKQTDQDANVRKWELITKSSYTVKTLHYFSKHDDKDRYHEINQQERLQDLFTDDKDDIIEINSRYLLDKSKKLEDNTTICNEIKRFYNIDIKCLTLRSPYDTGKTQMMKEIIAKYDPKRILWITYRRTLTYDIFSNFKEFNVRSYLDRNFTANRLIIQLESLLNLDAEVNLFNEVEEVPKYDLVVLDEIESLLNQFASDATFKGKNEDTFLFLEQIIRASTKNGKIIALDGDLGQRSYKFLDNVVNSSINIRNTVNFNDMTLTVKPSRTYFENQIIGDLMQGLKLFIPCMSNTFAEELKALVNQSIPGIKVKLYNSTTDDNIKELDIKNISDVWSKQQCVITTPTIEAGVSFDREHFDKIYGVISEGSCSQTAFFQMMKRVRKVRNKTVEILNYSNFKLNTYSPWTFEEVKEGMLFNSEIRLATSYTDTDDGVQINRQALNSFQTNFIFNKVVELNKQKPYFLSIFKHIAISKGYQFILEGNESQNETNVREVNLVNEKVMDAEDLTDEAYEDLLRLQRITNITEAQKLQIQKHVVKRRTGLDIVDLDLVKKFRYQDLVVRFASLIDLDNEKSSEDNNRALSITEHKYIREIITRLGFDHIFDGKKINRTNFVLNMREVVSWLSTESVKCKDFNLVMNKSRHNIRSMVEADFKKQMYFINSFLSSYSFKIGLKRVREDGHANMVNYYVIEFQNSIDELLEYRVNRGYKLVDELNIFIKPSTIAGRQMIYRDKVVNDPVVVEEPTVRKNKTTTLDTSSLDIGVNLDDD